MQTKELSVSHPLLIHSLAGAGRSDSTSFLDKAVVRQTLMQLGLDEDSVADVMMQGQVDGAFESGQGSSSPGRESLHNERATANVPSGELASPMSNTGDVHQHPSPGGSSDVHVSPPRRGEMPKMSYDESFEINDMKDDDDDEEKIAAMKAKTQTNNRAGYHNDQCDARPAPDGSAATSDMERFQEHLMRVTQAANCLPLLSSPSPRLRDARSRIASACRPLTSTALHSPLHPQEFASQRHAKEKKKPTKHDVISGNRHQDPTLTDVMRDEGTHQNEEDVYWRRVQQDQEIDQRLRALFLSECHAAQRMRHDVNVEHWLKKHAVSRCSPPPLSTTFYPSRIDRADIVARSAVTGTIMSRVVKQSHGDYMGGVLAQSRSRSASRDKKTASGRSGIPISGGPKYHQPTHPQSMHRPIGIPTTLPNTLRCDVVTKGNDYQKHWRRCGILSKLEKRTSDTWAARFAMLDTR